MSIGNPNPKPPTPEEAFGYIRDLLAELDAEGDAVLATAILEHKVAGPLRGSDPRRGARYSLLGEVGTIDRSGDVWLWCLKRAAYLPDDMPPTYANGRAETRADADSAMVQALRGLGWTLLAQPEEELAQESEPRTALEQALDHCRAHPGSVVWLVVANEQGWVAAHEALQGLEDATRDGMQRYHIHCERNILSDLYVVRAYTALLGRGFDLAVVSGDSAALAAVVDRLWERGRTTQSEVRWLRDEAVAR